MKDNDSDKLIILTTDDADRLALNLASLRDFELDADNKAFLERIINKVTKA